MIIKEIDERIEKFEESEKLLKELSEIKLPKKYYFQMDDSGYVHLYVKVVILFKYQVAFIYNTDKGIYFYFVNREDYEEIKNFLSDSKLNIIVSIKWQQLKK